MKKMNISNNKETKTRHKANILILEECNTIQQAEKLKNELLSAFSTTSMLQIKGNNIKNIDITFIQLMYALKCSSINGNKQIHFNIQLTDKATSLLVHNGFRTFFEALNI